MVRVDDFIVFENDDFLALNKPSGVLSIPDRQGKEISLKSLLQDRYEQIYTVHRLDRDTSGLILFAKNDIMHRHLNLQFEHRETEKIYNGLVLGSPQPGSGKVDRPIAENKVRAGTMIIHQRGKEAITDYEVLEDFRIYSWMRFRIHTGRTHQIRVHMKDIGHPLAVDELYGDGSPVFLSRIKQKFKLQKNAEEERPLLNRLALHAAQLKIKGREGDILSLEAPLPKDILATCRQLEKNRK